MTTRRASPKPLRPTKQAAAVGPAVPTSDRAVFPLPKTELFAESVPARIASVAVQAARYGEQPNPNPGVRAGVSIGALDLSMRAEYGWASDRAIALIVYAELKTPDAPVVVDAAVALRVVFEAVQATTNQDLWAFVKDAGIRIAYPFVRAHLATLTAMGSLGSIALEPLFLAMMEPTGAVSPEADQP